MAVDVVMPKLGVEMEKGRIVEWKKGEGEWVDKEKPLLVIETEKVTYEMESPGTGYLHIVVPVEQEVPVGTLLGALAESEEELKQIAVREVGEPVAASAAPAAAKPPEQPPAASATAPTTAQKLRVSPLARRLAEEHDVDITTVQGTGPEGRITKEDVLRAVEQGKVAPLAEKEAVPAVAREAPAPQGKRVKAALPLKGMRRVISERMFRSLQTTAQMTEFGEVDMTEMVKFRQQINAQLESSGLRISYPAIFVKAVAIVLKEQPIMNSSLEGEEIKLWEDINIGMAVAVEEGLIVPVVHGADKLSLLEISQTLSELVEKARRRTIMPDELSWGTFTITDVGSYGADAGTAILNPPEVAILALGRINKRPVVIDDEIVIRWMMSYGMTVDHRVIDGAVGGLFTQRFKQIMENPGLLAVF